jgi:muramoyltetrapeptide carboxypeptidase
MKDKKYMTLTRRKFMGEMAMSGAAVGLTPSVYDKPNSKNKIVKPPRLRRGDTIGLITPASAAFEPSTIREGVAALEDLGFRVKLGAHVGKKIGYLAGSDQERANDLMAMFEDDEVRGIIALRGGYGTIRMVNYLDFKLIRKNPKVLLGYSDIAFLHLALHKMAGLITFHGPVAISSFTDYTRRYFYDTLTKTEPVGEIIDAPDALTIHLAGPTPIVSGPLIGGNLTMIVATLGTPYEIDTKGKILFIEEVGEEPYAIDRMLTQLDLAGKLSQAVGVIIDRCAKCGPADYKPAFETTFSVEEVFQDRLSRLNVPVLFGLSLGHTADKPILPLGVKASLDVSTKKLYIDEAAVV